MKRIFNYLTAAIIICMLALTLSTPSALRTVRASDLQEKCDDCTIRNNERFEQCIAINNDQRCYDQYNEGVVRCFRNFCEQ